MYSTSSHIFKISKQFDVVECDVSIQNVKIIWLKNPIYASVSVHLTFAYLHAPHKSTFRLLFILSSKTNSSHPHVTNFDFTTYNIRQRHQQTVTSSTNFQVCDWSVFLSQRTLTTTWASKTFSTNSQKFIVIFE